MSVNASWLRMFIEMSKRHDLKGGNALALGNQDVMFTHKTAADLIQNRGIPSTDIAADRRTFRLSRNQKQFSKDPRHYMTVSDLWMMMGYSSLKTLDAFEAEQPDYVADLCKPVPDEFRNRFDLVFDIGVLEHTADIFQALDNVAAMLKPGGWVILYLPMVSPINSCMVHPAPKFFYENFPKFGLSKPDTFINWMPDWDQQNDIRTIWLKYQEGDDVEIHRPRFYTIMWAMARKEGILNESAWHQTKEGQLGLYSPDPIVPPVDSRPLPIQEQMLVGTPSREQLYL